MASENWSGRRRKGVGKVELRSSRSRDVCRQMVWKWSGKVLSWSSMVHYRSGRGPLPLCRPPPPPQSPQPNLVTEFGRSGRSRYSDRRWDCAVTDSAASLAEIDMSPDCTSWQPHDWHGVVFPGKSWYCLFVFDGRQRLYPVVGTGMWAGEDSTGHC